MGIGNLFKGYVFFKLVSLGIGFSAIGIIFSALTVIYGDPSLLLIAVPFLLIALGVLYVCLKIYRSEEYSFSTGTIAKIGYSKGINRELCPECGEKEMDVSFDGSGVCDNCGYATKDYQSEK